MVIVVPSTMDTKLREMSYVVEEQENSHANRSANGGDDSSDKIATITAIVEFPMDSTPFWRRNSIDSYHSTGSSSRHDAGGSDQDSRENGGDSSNSSSDSDLSTTENSNSSAIAMGILQRQL